ncbi:MAG: trypsin-like peptidase domain-containing protein [Candidatus Nealsonbacteria bacterium]|nr:trypsin-like peptidase domain-containing protein [Candidatus Nealsonbacteria bacterium]
MIAVMMFVGIVVSNIDRENNLLKQRVFVLEMKLISVSSGLEKIDNDNTLLAKKVEVADADLRSAKRDSEIKIRKTEEKLSSAISAVENKTAELENNKADRRELGLVEFSLMGNIDNLEANFKKDLAMVNDKIFDPAVIYEKTQKSVVKIETNKEYGTGFLFGKKNQILTAYHVVKSPPGIYVKVFLNDGVYSEVLGKIKRIKPEWDLAIIELAVPLNAEPLMPADIRNLAVGDNILLIGNPNKFNNSASAGIVSGFDRELKNLPLLRAIQIDSSIDFGSSGSPAIDKTGKVIGLVNMGMTRSSFDFIIPVNYINSFLAEE